MSDELTPYPQALCVDCEAKRAPGSLRCVRCVELFAREQRRHGRRRVEPRDQGYVSAPMPPETPPEARALVERIVRLAGGALQCAQEGDVYGWGAALEGVECEVRTAKRWSELR